MASRTVERGAEVVAAALDCQSGGLLSRMGATGAVGGTSCGQLLQGVAAIVQNPGQVIDEMVKPFKEAWNNGEYGKLAGLAVGTIAEALLGSKGIGNGLKSAKHGMEMVENAAKRADPPCNSFVPGTLVLLADGTSKPIEELVVGDMVLATDPVSGRTEPRDVTATIVGSGVKHLVEISVDTDGEQGDSTSTVTATDEHPFWVVNRGGWRDANELRIGDQVRTDRGGQLPIVRVGYRIASQPVHNLTVDGLHTYYVLVGEAPVLVHNTNGCINWNSSSVKTWGHTFKTHGAGEKNTRALTDRASGTGNEQGQWLDNDAAAEFLKGLHVDGAGPRSVRIPEGLGQVILPDRQTIVQARAATIVPSRNGLYKTGFPIIGPK